MVYRYDGEGNILNKKSYPKTSAATITGTPTSMITYTYENESWFDLLTGYNGNTITYAF